jgi:hypothetical protein
MSGLFGKPQKQAPPPPPPPAPPPPVREDAQVVAENNADMLRKRRGRASTILTNGDDAPGLGDAGAVTTAAKVLGS